MNFIFSKAKELAIMINKFGLRTVVISFVILFVVLNISIKFFNLDSSQKNNNSSDLKNIEKSTESNTKNCVNNLGNISNTKNQSISINCNNEN